MFAPRVVCKVVYPIQTSLQTYRGQQLCGRTFKKFHVRAVLYCVNVKDHKVSDTVYHNDKLKVFNKDDELETQHNKYFKDNPEQLKYGYDGPQTTDHVENKSHHGKELQELFPSPLKTLHEFSALVTNELKIKNVISSSTKKCRINRNQYWEHTYNVSWPEEKSFSDVSHNKSLAVKKAASKCLSWLHSIGKLKGGRPQIYTQADIQKAITEPVEINVSPKFLDKMKSTIQKFNSDIKLIMEASDNLEDFDFVHSERRQFRNFGYAIDTLSQKRVRNARLKERLSAKLCQNSDLPIFQYREKILHHLKQNQVFLIKGDTGCGKTTQVPQFVMESYIEEDKATECNIIVSQPRRISAVSLAERVAYERNEYVGDVIGYQVRLDQNLPAFNHGITFCTTGILLRRFQFDPDLEGVTHVILDEAHERTVDIDMLLTLLKNLLERRKDIKLIVMSATINTELLQKYFKCPVVQVPGFLYPVKMHFLEDMENMGIIHTHDMYNITETPTVDTKMVMKLIQWICCHKPPGAILCFLPGWADISRLQDLLSRTDIKNLTIPVHSKLPHQAQQKIFSTPDKGIRKIILATDIAETGITVQDVAYVIDTAIKKESRCNSDNGLSYMKNYWISKANILQRKGRAGRVQAGESYHLISKEKFQKLNVYPEAEILRTPLDRPLLDSKRYTTQNAFDFFTSMPESPESKIIHFALNVLEDLGAIDSEENLTPLGKRMTYFTMDPRLSKAMIYSAVFNCVDPLISIGSIFSTEDQIFSDVLMQKIDIREKKKSFHNTSDHIAMLDICSDWQMKYEENSFEAKRFCRSMGLLEGKLHMLQRICELNKQNLAQSCMIKYSDSQDDIYPNQCSSCTELIRAVLFSSTNYLLRKRDFTFRKGRFTKSNIGFQSKSRVNVMITQDSVNYKQTQWPTPFLTYLQSVHSDERRKTLIRETSMITPLTVFLFSRDKMHYRNIDSDDNEKVSIQIGNQSFIRFLCDKKTFNLLSNIRKNLWEAVDYIIAREGVKQLANENDLKMVKQHKDEILDVIVEILDEASTSLDP